MLHKVSYSVIIRFLSLAVNMLTFILTAQYFGPEGRGYIAAVNTVVATFATLAGFSIGRVLVFEIQKSQLSASSFYRKNIFTLLCICAILSILVWISAFVLYWGYPQLFGETPAIYYLLFFITAPTLIWQGYSSFIFASLDKLEKQNRILLFGLILYVIAAYAAVLFFKVPFIVFLLLMVVYNLSVGITEIVSVLKLTGMFRVFQLNTFKSLWASGLKLHTDTVGGLLITSSNMLIITSSMPIAEVGIFQFASQLINMMVILPTMVSLQFNADITSLGANKSFEKHRIYIWGVTGVMIAGCALAWLLAPLIITLLGGSEFESAIPVFRILLISVIGNSFSILISSQYSGRGYFKLVSMLTIILGLIGLGASYLGILNYGLWGAAYASNAVYTISMLINIGFYIFLAKKVKESYK